MLSLKEVRDAFAQVKDGWSNPEEKPFEVIAFDACLMSTYETAQALKDTANYMVASQEEGNSKVMFGYTDLLNKLSKNPAMSGAQLGKVICDTYWDDSKNTDKKFNMDFNAILTLSVTDLSENKMETLKTAYDNFGNAALLYFQQKPEELSRIFADFNKAANRTERYPSEAASKHFSDYQITELVDLKGFAKNPAQNIPKLKQASDELVSAVNNAVIYQKRGDSLKYGGGLSTYYPFNLLENLTNINSYVELANDNLAPVNQANFYSQLYNSVIGNLKQVEVPVLDFESGKEIKNDETGEVIKEPKWQIPVDSIFNISDFSEVEVQLDERNKTAWIKLDENQLNRIENVRCQLIRTETAEGSDRLIGSYLGSDNSMNGNWQTGKFENTLRGKWLKIDGNIVSAQLLSDSTKRNKRGKKVGGSELYAIPINLNGASYAVLASCSYPNEKFRIIGARPIEEAQSTLAGTLFALNKGDALSHITCRLT
ncbi:MAG: hypothetical protein IJK81_02590 [Selenomonadaceae bacterium]|nr:hypothetical protein [Selenomonadaceae bacterium]